MNSTSEDELRFAAEQFAEAGKENKAEFPTDTRNDSTAVDSLGRSRQLDGADADAAPNGAR